MNKKNKTSPFVLAALALLGLSSAAAAELRTAADVTFSGEAMGVARRFIEYHLETKLESLAVLDG